uniref:hypothetical protein n=1 Tax=uncultured Tenacibaculum sp. TaxID=174713 RepID=UPI00260ABA7E|nr:hypothetical protein [uncultured Tenacibaculum sp.]
MKKETKNKIEKLLSILSEEEKRKDILEITEKNKVVYDFLEKNGMLDISYTVSKTNLRFPPEREGNIHLWNKNLNGSWEVNIHQINRILAVTWEK